jgi:hypothetical protein
MRSQGAVRGDVIGYAWELAQKHRFFHWELEFPEVFKQGGFDVVLGNPPFLGGLKISGTLGDKYRQYLEVAFAPFKRTADLCSAFYRRAFNLLKPGGRMGMVATNTIGQVDTRESGLAVIVKEGGKITFAKRFIKWPGAANVEVNPSSPSINLTTHQSLPIIRPSLTVNPSNSSYLAWTMNPKQNLNDCLKTKGGHFRGQSCSVWGLCWSHMKPKH